MQVKNTEILEVKDDIYKFSQNNVDCAVLWLKSGLSGLYADWMFEFLESTKTMKFEVIANNDNTIYTGLPKEIFIHKDHRFFMLTPGFKVLKYLYIFPNFENTWINADTIDTIPELINNALNSISKKPIQQIAFNGILGAAGQGHDQNVDDNIAKQMIQSIKDWLDNNPSTKIEKIFLVNRSGRGFNLDQFK